MSKLIIREKKTYKTGTAILLVSIELSSKKVELAYQFSRVIYPHPTEMSEPLTL